MICSVWEKRKKNPLRELLEIEQNNIRGNEITGKQLYEFGNLYYEPIQTSKGMTGT
jgi:hypothetical protein